MTSISPFPPGARVAAYLRDSGHEDQELSVEQQEASIRTWCESAGLLLTAVYKDGARPGSSTVGRDAFNDMIHRFRVPNCPERGVIIWKYNRFARSIDDAQFYKADLRRRGYIIHSLNDSVPDGLDGRFYESAIDWMNARYLEDLKADVKRGVHHLIDTHGALGGTPPRGFIRQEVEIGAHRDGRPHIVNRWEPDPKMTEIIREAFRMRARGESYKTINHELHLYRSTSSMEHFFSNPLYIGEMHFAHQLIPDYCQAIVDRPLWDAVQLVQSKQRARVAPGPDRVDHPRRGTGQFLLTGLAYCARCGAMLIAETVQFKTTANYRYQYYACSGENRNTGCDARRIPRPILENAILDNLVEVALSTGILTAGWEENERMREEEEATRTQRLEDLARQLSGLRRRIANLIDLLADQGRNASTGMLEKLREMEIEETVMRSQLAILEAQRPNHDTLEDLQVRADVLRLALSSADTPTLKKTLNGLVKRITAEIDLENKNLLILVENYLPPEEGDFYGYGLCPGRGSSYTHKSSLTLPIHHRDRDAALVRPALIRNDATDDGVSIRHRPA